MEAGFLNFHDEEHFSDFSISLDHQTNLLAESQNTLVNMVDNDFDYIEGLDLDSNDDPWEMEQELNGDLAVLPVSGVAGVHPKIENIKEDFAKVLTDWQEHVGYLQCTGLEEDVDLINSDMGLDINAISSIDKEETCKSILSRSKNNINSNMVKCESSGSRISRISESDQSEKEIDVVGLDSVEDVNPVIDSMHVKRQQATFPSKNCNYKSIADKYINIVGESCNDIIIKEEPIEDKKPLHSPILGVNLEFSKINKRIDLKNGKKENKKIIGKSKNANVIGQFKSEFSIIDENNGATSLSPKKAVLEAGDVASLLEQFEATEVIPRMTAISQLPKIPLKKYSASFIEKNCQRTLLKKLLGSQHCQSHEDIRDSLPKEVIDRIKASGRKRQISVIPAMPNKKAVSKNSGIKMQEVAATPDRSKLHKLVQKDNVSPRLHDFVQLDHDYCSSNASAAPSSRIDTKRDAKAQNEQPRANSAPRSSKVVVKKPWLDSGSRKDSGLESGEVSDAASEEQAPSVTKIQSALATSILRQRETGLVKKPQMISVLKRQKPAPQAGAVSSLAVESIITTTTSSNGQVQNIIVQESSEAQQQQEKQQPTRRKLNLAEYRTRRFEQRRNDGSRTSSPVQPMALVYVHHASTGSEPVCCEREIVSVLKPKSELEEEQLRRGQPRVAQVEDKATQTAQSVFGLYAGTACRSSQDLHPEETDSQVAPLGSGNGGGDSPERGRRRYRRARASSSSSSSRSRSRSRSQTCSRRRELWRRSRSRGCRQSRTRSRNVSGDAPDSGRGRSFARQRRVSHRRSSVSSSSSSSCSRSRSRSRSRSYSSTSPSRARSRYLSRYRSSSRSSCRSRYSSCSRSPSRSNIESFKRESPRRQGCRNVDLNGYRDHSSIGSRRYAHCRRKSYEEWYVREKQRQVEERRVVYVGRLKDGITKAELRKRFEAFGPVVDISVHFREHGHNYGFVTFSYKNDAYQAVEHGNDDPSLPRYDLCFGGRRAFCKVKYADLDGAADESADENGVAIYKPEEENTFDLLLKEAQAKLRKRKV